MPLNIMVGRNCTLFASSSRSAASFFSKQSYTMLIRLATLSLIFGFLFGGLRYLRGSQCAVNTAPSCARRHLCALEHW